MPSYLAIDYGTKRIGLAVGDDEMRVATPLRVVPGRNDPIADAQTVLVVAAEHGVDALVVGLPLNMDDSESNQSRLTRRFGTALAERSGLPVQYQDERLSSFAADEHLAGSDLTRKQRKAQRDKLAAAAILQDFLDGGSR